MMFEVRFHGRGGQGTVTAAEMLSVAAFDQGRHAQAFPMFGSERTGAPVVAFCRVADGPIRAHDPVLRPDALVVQDPTLLAHVPVLAGATRDTFVLVNTMRFPHELRLEADVPLDPAKIRTVAATELARRFLGRPLPNTALLGGLAAQTRVVSIEALSQAIRQRFPGSVGVGNVRAAEAAYALVAAAGQDETAGSGISSGHHPAQTRSGR